MISQLRSMIQVLADEKVSSFAAMQMTTFRHMCWAMPPGFIRYCSTSCSMPSSSPRRDTLALNIRAIKHESDSWLLRFEVQDTGIGIDPKVVPKLFAPFTQADASTTRRFGGSGLGLSIVKQLAQLMGGNVGVVSSLHKGSVFLAGTALQRQRPAKRAQF